MENTKDYTANPQRLEHVCDLRVWVQSFRVAPRGGSPPSIYQNSPKRPPPGASITTVRTFGLNSCCMSGEKAFPEHRTRASRVCGPAGAQASPASCGKDGVGRVFRLRPPHEGAPGARPGTRCRHRSSRVPAGRPVSPDVSTPRPAPPAKSLPPPRARAGKKPLAEENAGPQSRQPSSRRAGASWLPGAADRRHLAPDARPPLLRVSAGREARRAGWGWGGRAVFTSPPSPPSPRGPHRRPPSQPSGRLQEAGGAA